MSLQETLPLPLLQGTPRQQREGRQQEVDLLRRLQQARAVPELMALRQLLAVRLALCQAKLVKASLDDVPLLQGEARALERLLYDLSGERAVAE
jgi:hypothetical protein